MSTTKRPGRPTVYGTAATIRLQLRVTPAVRLELQRVATERGTGVPGLLRELIDTAVEDQAINVQKPD